MSQNNLQFNVDRIERFCASQRLPVRVKRVSRRGGLVVNELDRKAWFGVCAEDVRPFEEDLEMVLGVLWLEVRENDHALAIVYQEQEKM